MFIRDTAGKLHRLWDFCETAFCGLPVLQRSIEHYIDTGQSVTVNPTPPAVSATTEPTATSQNSNNDSTRVGLGVGLAVGLFGTIAGGVSAWFAWKMYRLKKA